MKGGRGRHKRPAPLPLLCIWHLPSRGWATMGIDGDLYDGEDILLWSEKQGALLCRLSSHAGAVLTWGRSEIDDLRGRIFTT
jgi:hypothetical protein